VETPPLVIEGADAAYDVEYEEREKQRTRNTIADIFKNLLIE
jgi:hypothetical protein